MGLLVDGKWQANDLETPQISFLRTASVYRNWIKADGSSAFPAEADRYHLYISLGDPWCARVLIFYKLKKLENIISLSIVDPVMLENGWTFSNYPGCTPDIANDKKYLHEIYSMVDPMYTGRVTVPLLWDKQTRTIVNNESADIIRIFNSEFNEFTKDTADYYPSELRHEIDKINDFIYNNISNGVYKCGVATRQDAYEIAYDALFGALDILEDHFSENDYLVGDQLTEADWRLFATLIRFDAVYYTLFKCNKFRIIDYEHLHDYLLNLYKYPGISDTVNMDHIKRHYYVSLVRLNPNQIVPKGPDYI